MEIQNVEGKNCDAAYTLIFNSTEEFSWKNVFDPQHNTLMLDRIPCFPSEYLVY